MTEFLDNTQAVLEALRAGQKRVGMRYLNLTEEDAIAIADVLSSDTATERLSIVNAGLNAARMAPLLNALKKNTHLKYLNLNGNSGGTESAKLLAEALGSNKTLTEIFLTGNNIWDEGGQALLAAVENSQVQMLDLDSNKVDKAILKKIATAMEDNY